MLPKKRKLFVEKYEKDENRTLWRGNWNPRWKGHLPNYDFGCLMIIIWTQYDEEGNYLVQDNNL